MDKNYYFCSKCNGIVRSDKDCKTIKSECEEAGNVPVRLTRITSADDLARRLREYYLKNAFDLDSFKPKERLWLESAFEQGAKVVFNRLK